MKCPKTITDWVNEYLTHRRNLGFQMGCEQGELLRFASYVTQRGIRGPFTSDLMLDWIQTSPKASRNYQARRLATLRSFAKYLAIYEPSTEIPPAKVFGPAGSRPEPHIYSPQEMRQLFRSCEQLKPAGSLRPKTYRVLFGLLAVTGLRISEALKLNNSDVDLDQGILTVRDSKFRKSRLVPLHPSTLKALLQYVLARDQYHPVVSRNSRLASGTAVQGLASRDSHEHNLLGRIDR